MNQAQLEKFVVYLQKENWLVFGPTLVAKEDIEEEEISPYLAAHQPPKKKQELILIKQIEKPTELVLNERLPFYSFKRFFVPEYETMFEYQGVKLKDVADYALAATRNKIALIGLSILDLKTINLYEQVFEKDPYYQARRKKILTVGHSVVPEIENNFFEYKYEEDILEHLPFDIFLAAKGQKNYRVFSGSIRGQRILEHFGYKDYEHIQFSGPVREGKLEERMVLLREKLKDKHTPKIWEELGNICIECGKCTIACPTCFCFRIDEEPSLKENYGVRSRCWDACFYQEFSEVAGLDVPGRGKPKFLNNTAQRIHFWYFHKFARIPDEFDFMGCVGCRRCAKVCPVGIDIAKVLKSIEES